MQKLSRALFLLIVATAAHAEWKPLSTKNEPSGAIGLEHRHFVVEDSETNERATVDLAIFAAKSFLLRLIDNPNGEKSLADAVEDGNCLAGVNGGYFDPQFAPIGLRISEGKVVAPLRRARLLTGILASLSTGIRILRIREFPARAKIDAALECGPMIVDLGERVHGLDDTRAARRTFAAVDHSDRAAFGVSSDLTLAELGKILAMQFAGDFKIWRALNLDGGSSSAFWFRRKDGSAFSISEQKKVRDFIGVGSR